MIQRLLLLAIVLGVVARLFAWSAHEHPRGDVLLDVGVARSLNADQGFASGFERGTAMVRGEREIPPQDQADQHPPLWPIVGAVFAGLAGSAFGGLKLGSLLLGLLLLACVWREADRATEGCVGAPDGLPALAAALVALSFLMLEFSVNGSLYIAQACLVVLLVRALSSHRLLASAGRGGLVIGLILGAAWMLNHQAAVLLPVPLVVLLLAPPDGGRARATTIGLLAIGVAAAVAAPWWMRNAQVFGDPFYSVNAFYPLYASGVLPTLGIEGGVPVARMPDASLLAAMLGAQKSWLPPNVLYLLTTGLMLWPGLLALVAAGAWPVFRAARRAGDRRVLTCLVALAVLLVVSLVWPAMKLRYFVPMTPLVVVLGMRVLAAGPARGERIGAYAVALVWLGALLYTIGDLTGTEADPRPERWRLLLLSGAIFLVLPLLLRHTKLAGSGLALGLCSGVMIVPVLSVIALLGPPHTAYHSSVLTPDFFGQPKEQLDERAVRTLQQARAAALADGSRRMIAPMELLAYGEPAMVREPMATAPERIWVDDPALIALVDRGDIDHVFTFALEGLTEGELWLGDRLEVIATWISDEDPNGLAGGTLARVVRR
jgi:4-amino-4-deoxy-L-arabinose transferase-like glycosyltransferase